MKRIIQLAVLAVIAKIAYDYFLERQPSAVLPDGAPYEPAPRPADSGAAPDAVPQQDLTEVTGIGPVYAGKLQELDIASFSDLATADPEALAEGLDVSVAMVTEWQAQARELRT